MSRTPLLQAVFFDLDGTLLDTATDIATATNQVLVHHQLKPQPVEYIRPLVGQGVGEIIKKLFFLEPDSDKFSQIRHQILAAYQQVMLQETKPFPGIDNVLTLLNQHSIPWGIITNKPMWLAQPLVDRIEHLLNYHLLIGREVLPFAKPHPLPLNYACQQIKHITPRHCVYVGDAKTDILAAKAAGMQSIAAAYGYILPEDDPKKWQADYLITSPDDLLTWLQTRLP